VYVVFYSAPEEVEVFKKNQFNLFNSLDSSKLDAFSIGMTILDMVMLRSNEDLYGNGCRFINKEEL
jgi:hypothetical protein